MVFGQLLEKTMLRRLAAAWVAGVLALSGSAAFANDAYNFSFRTISGDPLPFETFRGRPVLVVNTASRCGFTHQYSGLQALWEQYRDAGLVVLAVPSDDFNQELASESAVKEFCEVNFAIDFPMTEIEHVRGAKAHPFYNWVGVQEGQPRWNFYKYLIAADGELIDSFSSITGPQNRKLTRRIEQALADATVRERWREAERVN